MTGFHVDSDLLLSTPGAVRGYQERIQADVGGLTGLLTNLQSSWTGQAAGAFQAVVVDWRATEQRVYESLGGINQALLVAGRQYAEIEQANVRLFSR